MQSLMRLVKSRNLRLAMYGRLVGLVLPMVVGWLFVKLDGLELVKCEFVEGKTNNNEPNNAALE